MDALNFITGFFIALSCGALALGCGMGVFIARRAAHERSMARASSITSVIRDEPLSPPRPACWLAIQTKDLDRVRATLGLQNTRACSFAEALTAEQSMFIAPSLNGWVIVTGADLPEPSEDVDACYKFMVRLSRQFSQAQFFSAAEFSNHHAWIRAQGGRVIRAYVWNGSTQWLQGQVTPEEKALGMASYPYGTCVDDAEVNGDLLRQTTERVALLAAKWSIDPARIDTHWFETRQGIAGECES